jgi:hypothetical protein
MTKEKSPNDVKASNLILITAVITIVNYLLVGPFTTLFIIAIVIGVAIIVTFGLLAQQGYPWFKWLYLGFFVLEIVNALQTIRVVAGYSLIARCLLVLHYIIQIIAIVLLFRPKKQPIP